MNILIDINHPAHVHLFKNAIQIWQDKGYKVLIVPRDKDVTMDLVKYFGFTFNPGTYRRPGLINLFKELFQKTAILFKVSKEFRPGIVISAGSAPAAWAARLYGVPHLAFIDNEHAREQYVLFAPFTKAIFTSTSYRKNLGRKQVRYNGFHELAYLHPNWFQPDQGVLKEVGLREGDSLFIVRFVSWQASHDIGHHGFTLQGKLKLVQKLEKLGKVVITVEGSIPDELKPYILKISPFKIHDLLYFSSLYIGEGATMASEAAMLGVPSIYVNTITAGTLEEQEHRYGLLHQITDEDAAISLALRLAGNSNICQDYKERARHMLEEKIDVTQWIVDVVENYTND